MLRSRRAPPLLLAAALCLTLLAGCAGREADGMSLSVCVGESPITFDPIYASTVGDQTILVHLYENLMRLTVDIAGEPTVTYGMAKSVDQEENHDGTVTYTFRLRSARWSDGRAVRAGDFVYAWRRLADPNSSSENARLLSVVAGYDEARASGNMELLQVSAKNDSTLVVTLKGRYDWFLQEVCTAPATMPLRQDVVQKLKTAAEKKQDARWWSDPTALVTNGAYQATGYEAGASLTAAANGRYYGSHTGPRELTFYFAAAASSAQALYDAKAVDAIWPLPEEQIGALLAEGETGIPTLGTYAVLFNCRHELLADPRVRQALHLAIDRNALAAAAGPAAQAASGLVPPGVPEDGERDFRTAGGALLDNDPEAYPDRCVHAREVLAEAGYDSGVSGVGELEYLYLDQGTNGAVAQELCRMWQEVLHVKVTPRGVTAKALWSAARSGEYDMAGIALTSLCNDAEGFLTSWTSDSPENFTGYGNSAFDTLMSIVIPAEGTARLGCLHDAESLLLSDDALAPLYTTVTDWRLRETLTGACRDARGWFTFASVTARPS